MTALSSKRLDTASTCCPNEICDHCSQIWRLAPTLLSSLDVFLESNFCNCYLNPATRWNKKRAGNEHYQPSSLLSKLSATQSTESGNHRFALSLYLLKVRAFRDKLSIPWRIHCRQGSGLPNSLSKYWKLRISDTTFFP